MKLSLSIPVIAALIPAFAHAAGVVVTVTDAAGKPLEDAVVFLEAAGGSAVKPTKTGDIEQKGLKFLPLVTVIPVGSKMNFPNNDKVRHHIYSFSPAKKFDQKLYSGVAATPQVFDKAGTVVLGCNIHDKMIAYIKVVDTPHYAKTDAAGVAKIELPAAGKYTVTAWHYNQTASAKGVETVAIKAEGAAPLRFALAQKPPVVESDGPSTSY